VDHFLLYDFFTPEGVVNEDVFAYSNRQGDERSLVVYHNKFAETRGWVKRSSAYMDKPSGRLVQKELQDGLGIPPEGFAIFKDYVTNLEYIRSCQEITEKGLFILLGGYQCHVFLDWRFISGDDALWSEVAADLNGAGVSSLREKYNEIVGRKRVIETPGNATPKVMKRGRGQRIPKTSPAGVRDSRPKKSHTKI
jgi:hypothetical protein